MSHVIENVLEWSMQYHYADTLKVTKANRCGSLFYVYSKHCIFKSVYSPSVPIKPCTLRLFYIVSQNSLCLITACSRISLFFIHPLEHDTWGVYYPMPGSNLYIQRPTPSLLSLPPSSCPLHWLPSCRKLELWTFRINSMACWEGVEFNRVWANQWHRIAVPGEGHQI